MKNTEAIAKTRKRLEQEFLDRKEQKLTGLKRHRSEILKKIEKLQVELTQIDSKIRTVESCSFRDPIPPEDQRRQQSELAKQSNS